MCDGGGSSSSKECVHKKAESDPNVVDSNTDTCCEDIGMVCCVEDAVDVCGRGCVWSYMGGGRGRKPTT